MSRTSRYSPEFRQRALHLFHEQQDHLPSKWAALNAIAGKVGCTAETLRKWVKQYEIDHGQREGLSTSERERSLPAMENEVKAGNPQSNLKSVIMSK